MFTIEIEGQGTPIFKCAGSKREFYKDIQPKKIIMEVDPFTLSHDIIEVIIIGLYNDIYRLSEQILT